MRKIISAVLLVLVIYLILRWQIRIVRTQIFHTIIQDMLLFISLSIFWIFNRGGKNLLNLVLFSVLASCASTLILWISALGLSPTFSNIQEQRNIYALFFYSILRGAWVLPILIVSIWKIGNRINSKVNELTLP